MEQQPTDNDETVATGTVTMVRIEDGWLTVSWEWASGGNASAEYPMARAPFVPNVGDTVRARWPW